MMSAVTLSEICHLRKELLSRPYPIRRMASSHSSPGETKGLLWEEAPPLPFFVPVTLASPLSRSDVRVLWDDQAIHIRFDLEDLDIVATLTERDAPVWEEDVAEMFLKPYADETDYYEINVSPRGTLYDSWIVKRGARAHKVWSRWNNPDIHVETEIRGTPNDWTVRDEGYVVQASIPFASLPSLRGRSPAPGDRWRMNLARYDYSVHLPEGRELSASSPLTEVDFHRYEDWRSFEFLP